jgi:hypothetical protein
VNPDAKRGSSVIISQGSLSYDDEGQAAETPAASDNFE